MSEWVSIGYYGSKLVPIGPNGNTRVAIYQKGLKMVHISPSCPYQSTWVNIGHYGEIMIRMGKNMSKRCLAG